MLSTRNFKVDLVSLILYFMRILDFYERLFLRIQLLI